MKKILFLIAAQFLLSTAQTSAKSRDLPEVDSTQLALRKNPNTDKSSLNTINSASYTAFQKRSPEVNAALLKATNLLHKKIQSKIR